MNFIKNVTAKHLVIYIGSALGFNLLLVHLLFDPFVGLLGSFYLSLPEVLQKLFFPVSDSLATTAELSELYAVTTITKLSQLIELSSIIALLWLVFKGVSKFWENHSKTAAEDLKDS